jgi:hypothetical protein
MPPLSRSKNKPSYFGLPPSATYLLGLHFDREDGGDILLRNVGLSPNYTALLRLHPSF